MAKSKAESYVQKISGVLDLSEVHELAELPIKIAVARNCRILHARVFPLKAGQKKLEYSLEFKTGQSKPVGVRLIAGPDVPDEALRSIDHQQVWVAASQFKRGGAKIDLAIPNKLHVCWLRCCRTYTLRGRLVCRKWVWDPIEQQFVSCDAPVRGAEVTAYDVDRFLWWYRRDPVGSDFTDLNGFFEIKFTWCCWWWRPWYFRRWQLDPDLVDRIQKLLQQRPIPIPIPRPDPTPDFSVLRRFADELTPRARVAALSADDGGGGDNLVRLGEQIARAAPSEELRALRVWPWYPIFDCRPDIIFRATQDCGEGEEVVYSESAASTRWNISTELNGVTLVANDNACCGPYCCSDPPDDDCLAIHGVGCGSYPIEHIEQDATDPLLGYAQPGSNDRPFGGTIRILGVFGDGGDVDFYKPQRRRLSPAPTGWMDVPEDEISAFSRGHWLGWPPPLHQYEVVKPLDVGGEKVLKTIRRYREENPLIVDTVDPSNGDRLFDWKTAQASGGMGSAMPGLVDGAYELRFIGYRYDAANDQLIEPQVMALCPPEGEDVDPALQATIRLRLDNRTWSQDAGSVHTTTTEPDCDFPNICAVVINENPALPLAAQMEKCVDPCGFARVQAGDTLTVHFEASDSDGHLEQYTLTAHWGESDVFNVLTAGVLAGDPDPLYGPTYGATFLGGQGLHRAGLPPADPEHDRPFWYGGNFKVTVPVDGIVPANPHKAFETCCAYQLELWTWKRTTNGCNNPQHFQNNHCEFSFTVIREDLIGQPGHPGCTELCPPEEQVD